MQTIEIVRERIHAAVLTANWQCKVGPRPPGSAMPRHLYELEDLEEGDWRGSLRSEGRAPSFVPTGEQNDDMPHAMALLAARPADGLAKLDKWEWSALYKRARQEWLWSQLGGRRMSWRAVADAMRGPPHRINRSDEWFRVWHRSLMARALFVQQSVDREKLALGGLANFGHSSDKMRPDARAA
jgi:hypothetical protein